MLNRETKSPPMGRGRNHVVTKSTLRVDLAGKSLDDEYLEGGQGECGRFAGLGFCGQGVALG